LTEPEPEPKPVDSLMVGAALALTLHEIADALDRLAGALEPKEKQ